MLGQILSFIVKKLYQPSFSMVLWPLVLLEQISTRVIASRFKQRIVNRQQKPPVIIVGNITLGGVGKTPIVASLANHFKVHNKVVIVSRGYGAKTTDFPYLVQADSNAQLAGDEPVMLAQLTGCEVVIAPKRLDAYHYAKDRLHADIVISDDGLQHYALPRAYELCVMDSQRFIGNGHCIPAGPLREPVERLKSVDAVLFLKALGIKALITEKSPLSQVLKSIRSNIYPYKRLNGDLINASTQERLSVHAFQEKYGTGAHALCAIGNANAYFDSLACRGFTIHKHEFSDHHQFSTKDFLFHAHSDTPIIMTHKDAVKCQQMNLENAWIFELCVELPDALIDNISQKLSLTSSPLQT